MEKPIIVFDLDGVIAGGSKEEIYSDSAGWAFEKCHVLEGAREGLARLSQDYTLVLSTARRETDTEKTIEWLDDNGLSHFFDSIEVGKKPIGDLYIDDRGCSFSTWDKLMSSLYSQKVSLELVVDESYVDRITQSRNILARHSAVAKPTTIEETRTLWMPDMVRRGLLWVILRSGAYCGFIKAYDVSGDTCLTTVVTDIQRDGVGSEAIRLVGSELRDCGFRMALAEIRADNVGSLIAHLKAGYTFEGRIQNFWRVGDQLIDKITMSRKLV